MKRTLLIAIIMVAASFCKAQTFNENDMIAYATPSKDTLFVNDNEGGKEIMKVWDSYTGPKKPVIVVTPNLAIIACRYNGGKGMPKAANKSKKKK